MYTFEGCDGSTASVRTSEPPGLMSALCGVQVAPPSVLFRKPGPSAPRNRTSSFPGLTASGVRPAAIHAGASGLPRVAVVGGPERAAERARVELGGVRRVDLDPEDALVVEAGVPGRPRVAAVRGGVQAARGRPRVHAQVVVRVDGEGPDIAVGARDPRRRRRPVRAAVGRPEQPSVRPDEHGAGIGGIDRDRHLVARHARALLRPRAAAVVRLVHAGVGEDVYDARVEGADRDGADGVAGGDARALLIPAVAAVGGLPHALVLGRRVQHVRVVRVHREVLDELAVEIAARRRPGASAVHRTVHVGDASDERTVGVGGVDDEAPGRRTCRPDRCSRPTSSPPVGAPDDPLLAAPVVESGVDRGRIGGRHGDGLDGSAEWADVIPLRHGPGRNCGRGHDGRGEDGNGQPGQEPSHVCSSCFSRAPDRRQG